MSIINDIEADLKVHVVTMPPGQPDAGSGQKRSTYSNLVLDNTNGTTPLTKKLMGQSANRTGLIVTFIGQSSDVAYLCGSMADGQELAGAQFMGLQVTPELHGTEEVWVAVGPGISMQFGVIATFCGK